MRASGTLRKLRRPKIWLPLGGLFILILVAIVIVHNLNAPAVGNIEQTPATQAEKSDPYAQPGNYDGKYIGFRYPAHFKKVPAQPTGNTKEVVIYHATDSTGKQISVAVYPGGLSDDSSVVYRRQHPELYTESRTQKWLEFTKKDGTEDTFFIAHNGLTASVSATAPYNNQAGDGLFVASSLKWK